MKPKSERYREETQTIADEDVIVVVTKINAEYERMRADAATRNIYISPRYASALDVAEGLRIRGAERLGNGAVKGSWSGYMSPALRIAPRLRSMTRRGLLRSQWDDGGRRRVYRLP